jgi:all-trans-nonaprenyl-diphosphate synthase|tara:strand:- start:241 stop:783 length:543 start_codon:yes stop_codon:yes gene_type:complete
MDLAEGEIKQNLNRFDSGQTFSKYLNKSYCKTASLIANSCKAAGVLSDLDDQKLTSLYEFGKNIGLAFQVVDDILDFTGNDKQLGKPAVSDLASGYLTAPVLYALEENKNLSFLINRELVEKDDLNNALNIIMNSKAIDRSRKLAEKFAMLSKEAILWLPDSEYKRALMSLPEFVLSRLY